MVPSLGVHCQPSSRILLSLQSSSSVLMSSFLTVYAFSFASRRVASIVIKVGIFFTRFMQAKNQCRKTIYLALYTATKYNKHQEAVHTLKYYVRLKWGQACWCLPCNSSCLVGGGGWLCSWQMLEMLPEKQTKT